MFLRQIHHFLRTIGNSLNRITTAKLMGLLGGFTGILSAAVSDSVPKALQPVSSLFFLNDSSAHPGLLYGLVIGLGAWQAGERRAWAIVVAFLVTVLAWSAAFHTALWIYEFKNERVLFGLSAARSSVGEATIVIKLLAGFLAGTVGAALTVMGCAVVIESLRRAIPIGSTVLVGGLAGLLLYPLLAGWNETISLVLLFSIWQASVGACLGHWFSIEKIK